MDELIKHYEEFKDRKDMDKDASYEAFAGLYLPVYSRIKVFSENFDFDNPKLPSSGGCSRIAVPAKRDGPLYIAFTENLKEIPVKLDGDFLLSGDTDFNVGTEKYSLCNYSMMPITGALNNDKGKKGQINDNWAMFVKMLPDLIKNPHTHNGRYRKELQPYKEKIVVAARLAYYNLFDNDIYNYCRNVYFFGVETEETKGIIKKALKSESEIEGEDYINLAREYWNLRAKILKENYGIDNALMPLSEN